MIGLKLTNVIGPRGGNYDYKGLDTNKFVPGTLVYPSESYDFYVITEQSREEIPEHEDIHLITEEEYEAAYEAERNRPREPGPIEKLQAENEELRRQLDALQLAVMGMMDEGGNA
ncbi:hypothetical protein WJ0W_006751 [Paenibacillus melissococcoides]|uniref:Uncharacterized protein n=1 Tax=Paenibacillus melissococcoides TaxID=2912268 RepID=A0ABM9G9T6_9BACL|nr:MULTISPECIES: hypothetical protein [Paenibacillus]MEB9894795.1 hypothetical protein [Bacillus cereus]CAH8244432.1 hypothetical protein WJ0W_001667 [Paenibacillus melissococcoides]CAH8244441.1 hypothetical protein WJ0W_001676 [Paenibacillus melissococcoides]CAH8247739.1 hypothetical protein WJ0W_004996 [Paenibacillus melissococcoides]CAH8248841.1 hypothetical protein WJ0W_006025 [Paenibacillus melissococcoides]